MDRRSFFHWFGLSGLSLLGLRLSACGTAPRAGSSLAAAATTRKVTVHDLVMEGWSTLGSGRLGDTGVLKATQIRDFQELGLRYVQDPHGHTFVLAQADLAKLLLGQPVSVLTTYAQGHRHEVRINPARHARDSQPIEVEIDEDGRPVGTNA